jgi:hypothetical protein
MDWMLSVRSYIKVVEEGSLVVPPINLIQPDLRLANGLTGWKKESVYSYSNEPPVQ